MTNKHGAASMVFSASTKVVFLLTLGVALLAGQPKQPELMTDAMVVELVQANISPDLIILAISQSYPYFQLDHVRKQYMLQIGVSEDIIQAMVAKQRSQPLPDDSKPSGAAVTPQGLVASDLSAQAQVQFAPPPLHPTVFINSANGFDLYIEAALHAKVVPITLVSSPEQADYMLDSSIFHTNDFASVSEVAFKLTNKFGAVMWTYVADNDILWGGNRSLAEACAKHLKQDLFWIYRRNGG
jgi:hypothetical protein